MAYADEQSYEEMIVALQSFMAETQEQCTVMISAGEDCVDNTDGDPAAEKASAKLSSCANNIMQSLEAIPSIIQALQEELEQIRIAASKADFDD